MRVLFICHRFPYPPKRGGKIRPFNIIRHLARSHEVIVASIARTREEAEEGQGLASHCAEFHVDTVDDRVQTLRMIARLPGLEPSSMGFFYSRRLARTVSRLLGSRSFDLIFVHCSSVAQYVAHVHDVPKILDFGDMDSRKWIEYSRFKPFPLSLGYRLEGTKLAAEERRLAERFDLCTTTTKAELETLRAYRTATPTGWFPNGVDTAFFTPTDDPYDRNTICFVGRMDYYPNQECMLGFCTNTWPMLRGRHPSLRLLIVGANPSPAIRRLGALDGVTVTGSVRDVRPYVRSSAAMVAPLNIARGTQNKLLEAMAMGVPVVTSAVAAGGVDAIPGQHLLVASTPREYGEALLRLLSDVAERRKFAEASRARMISNHAWPSSMERLDAMVAECVDSYRIKRSNQSPIQRTLS